MMWVDLYFHVKLIAECIVGGLVVVLLIAGLLLRWFGGWND